jgi:hypothetical protein
VAREHYASGFVIRSCVGCQNRLKFLCW